MTDADHTPHYFVFGAEDTCKHCGNRRDHEVHTVMDRETEAILLLQSSPARKGIGLFYDISRAHAVEAIYRALEQRDQIRHELAKIKEENETIAKRFQDKLNKYQLDVSEAIEDYFIKKTSVKERETAFRRLMAFVLPKPIDPLKKLLESKLTLPDKELELLVKEIRSLDKG